jgi:carbon storage regulator CsrA
MLLVPCKVHDTFTIGQVKFTVLHIRGERVRLRVDAPRDVAVYRGEVLQDLSEAARAALAETRPSG